MTDNARWVIPAGSTARDGFDLVVDDSQTDWRHTGLRVLTTTVGKSLTIPADSWEYVVVPLTGPVQVSATDAAGGTKTAELAGRTTVFAGPTDVAYVPAGSTLTLTGVRDGARIAVCAAAVPSPGGREFRHVPAAGVPVELRGAGIASREVRNFGQPDVLDADKVIACEVITPAGNWSSFPPHKHDEDRPGEETELEEIYYFETQRERSEPVASDESSPAGGRPRSSPGTAGERSEPVASEEDSSREARPSGSFNAAGNAEGGLGYIRVYGTDERPIDVLAEVRTGDVVLVPHGWHGPAMAPPGYDLYYLNVMAGPGDERAWLICDDPAHGWVRETWTDQDIDPRLPLGGKQ